MTYGIFDPQRRSRAIKRFHMKAINKTMMEHVERIQAGAPPGSRVNVWLEGGRVMHEVIER